MVKNIALIGASSEICSSLLKHLNKNKYNCYGISSSMIDKENFTETLKVNNYLEDEREIIDFLKDLNNLKVIFFNGFLAENREEQYPTTAEIINTDKINFVIPYVLTKSLMMEKNIDKFIFISSVAAIKPRDKNYIYGLSKSKLEKSIKKLNLKSYLIIRFGKVKTKMSKDHEDPPFTITSDTAGELIYKNLEKKGIRYSQFGIQLTSFLIRITPYKIIKLFKY